jgi:hypothetical protein
LCNQTQLNGEQRKADYRKHVIAAVKAHASRAARQHREVSNRAGLGALWTTGTTRGALIGMLRVAIALSKSSPFDRGASLCSKRTP